jgi:dipeptidyl aminopeptidase/acylaminoacyl peptidase
MIIRGSLVTGTDGAFQFDYQPQLHSGYRQLTVGPEANLAGPAWRTAVDDNIARAWDSSPASRIGNVSSPTLIIQGDSDGNVEFQESLGAIRALRQRQQPAGVLETMIVPDERHGFALFEHQLMAAEATFEFLARYLLVKAK